jgi:hypothetical protein
MNWQLGKRCWEEVMGDQNRAAMRLAVSAGWCFVGVCLGLWVGSSQILARAGQGGGAITVTGNAGGKHETPFMCSLEKTLTKEQREHKKQLSQKMENARIETQGLANGYVFRFRPEDVSFAEVADWVATERVCCPFFDLAIEAQRENGPLSLRITGREGVKEFIRMEFHTLKLG